jgi:chromosome partitioning protein
MDLSEIVTFTSRPNLDLAPSSPELAGAEVEMVSIRTREGRLRQVLSDIDAAYDLILIDTPPSLGLLTVNSLVAADGVVIPMQCEYLALEGVTTIMRTIEAICQGPNPHLDVLGILMTMYDGRTNLSRDVVEEARRHFPHDVFRTLIPRNIRLSEAPSFGEDILSYSPYCPGALAYQSLAEEILERMVLRWPT